MSTNGLEIFDTTVQETNHWLKLMMQELDSGNRRQSFNALRSGLHTLRDRLGVAHAVGLGAQLPMLLRGAYYEGWQPEGTPTHERHATDFLNRVDANLARTSPFDASEVTRATFRVLSECLDAGEMRKILHMLPAEIRVLCPDYAVSHFSTGPEAKFPPD